MEVPWAGAGQGASFVDGRGGGGVGPAGQDRGAGGQGGGAPKGRAAAGHALSSTQQHRSPLRLEGGAVRSTLRKPSPRWPARTPGPSGAHDAARICTPAAHPQHPPPPPPLPPAPACLADWQRRHHVIHRLERAHGRGQPPGLVHDRPRGAHQALDLHRWVCVGCGGSRGSRAPPNARPRRPIPAPSPPPAAPRPPSRTCCAPHARTRHSCAAPTPLHAPRPRLAPAPSTTAEVKVQRGGTGASCTHPPAPCPAHLPRPPPPRLVALSSWPSSWPCPTCVALSSWPCPTCVALSLPYLRPTCAPLGP